MDFSGKRILVTGGGRGIGRGLVKTLAASAPGATVFALSRDPKYLVSLKAEAPSVVTLCVDITDWDAVTKVVTEILPIHCLVNNAGVASLQPFLEATLDEFDRIFSVNVKAVMHVSQIVARRMIQDKIAGSIVNISSQASQAALQDHTIYCSSKGALDMMSKVMNLELGPHNIRVNCVNPTVTLTDMGRVGWTTPGKPDQWSSEAKIMLSKIPLGRFAEVDEVVNAILFLLSDKASMISGVSLPVDGGFLAT